MGVRPDDVDQWDWGDGDGKRHLSGEDHPNAKIQAWEARWIFYAYHIRDWGADWIASTLPISIGAYAVRMIAQRSTWDTVTQDQPTREEIRRQGGIPL